MVNRSVRAVVSSKEGRAAFGATGAIGPLPNMYDTLRYPENTLSMWAEGIAAPAALVLLVLMHLRIWGTRTATGAAARASASRPA